MGHEYPLSGSTVPEDKPLVSGDAVFFHGAMPAAREIVVAQDEMELILPVKSMQQIENTPMGPPDVPKPPVLP
jgi:hypothetical protein